MLYLKYYLGKVFLKYQERKLKRVIFRANRAKFETVFGLAMFSLNCEKTCFNSNRVRFGKNQKKKEIVC